jgi:Ca-activated chloride channel family protein
MKELETGMIEDGTAIGDALASAVNRLRKSEAKSKIVILLTDGVNNAGSLRPEDAARAAEALDIKVYTVGAGSTGLVRIPVQSPFGGTRYVQQRSEIDEPLLREIADVTGGLYFRAQNIRELDDIYEQIDRMEKTEIDVEQFTSYEDKFAPFLLASILFLSIEKLLSLSRFGRVTA